MCCVWTDAVLVSRPTPMLVLLLLEVVVLLLLLLLPTTGALINPTLAAGYCAGPMCWLATTCFLPCPAACLGGLVSEMAAVVHQTPCRQQQADRQAGRRTVQC